MILRISNICANRKTIYKLKNFSRYSNYISLFGYLFHQIRKRWLNGAHNFFQKFWSKTKNAEIKAKLSICLLNIHINSNVLLIHIHKYVYYLLYKHNQINQ